MILMMANVVTPIMIQNVRFARHITFVRLMAANTVVHVRNDCSDELTNYLETRHLVAVKGKQRRNQGNVLTQLKMVWKSK